MFKIKDGIYLEMLEDVAVLLDTMNERVVVLDDEEKNILNALLCKEMNSVVAEMLEKYEGEKEIIEQDVRMFSNKLVENGFIEVLENEF